ncbi:outer membrane protein assembly factor BamB family protein [Streptomyces griseus]|uniref:outer membrane protein assembly factor BamB family protein n=1 Tax=Streptomyces griseus TaxID=1911 RepID=UPI0008405D6E|nr:PQQ-binding-like beta-propeller repeat protein [Streptomyces griseus]
MTTRHIRKPDGYAADGALTRRRLLRMAGVGLGVAVAGTVTAACGPEEAGASGGTEKPKPGGGEKGGGDAFTTPPAGRAPRALWQEPAGVGSLGSDEVLAVVGDVVLIADDPLTARDLATGEKLWSLPGAAQPGARLIMGGDTLYLASGTYDGDLVGLDPATGKETWRSRLDGAYAQPRPIGADTERVYVLAGILEKDLSSRRNVIAAVDIRTGKAVWNEQRDAGTEEYGITPTVLGDRLVYTDHRENLTVRDTATGRQLWTKKISRSNWDRIAAHDGAVYVADGRHLRSFALDDGAERWALETEEFGTFNGPTVLEGVLYASDSVHALWAVDPATGKRRWHNADLGEFSVPLQFAQVGDTLYAATEFDENGGVQAYDVRSGTLRWTYNDGSGSVDPWYVVAGGKRLAALHGRRVLALPAV